MGLYQKSILFQETPPSLRATSFFPCLRGSTPKGGGSLKTPCFVYVCSFVTFVRKYYYQVKFSSFFKKLYSSNKKD